MHDARSGPSMWPSVGNWQQACQSHYIIDGGKIIWCGKWTPAEIAAGRRHEDERRTAHYEALYAKQGLLARFWRWLKGLLGLQ